MILDALQQFSGAQSLVQAAGTYDSANIVDWGINGIPTPAAGGGARDMGVGDNPALKLFAAMAQGAVSGGAATIQVLVAYAPDAGNGTPGAFYVAAAGPVVALAQSQNPACRLLNMDLPRTPPGQPLPRFCKLQYVIGGAALTAGSVNAYITLDPPQSPRGPTEAASGYPAGIAINN